MGVMGPWTYVDCCQGGHKFYPPPNPPQLGGREHPGEEVTAEMIRKQMTESEWQKIYEMSQDKHLYQNIISSLFPTIHGQ